MTCPDSARLLDVLIDGAIDPEALAHLRSCDRCRSEAALIRRVRAAFEPSWTVTDQLIDSAVRAVQAEHVDASREASEPRRPAFGQLAGSGVLGIATTVLVVVGTGSLQSTDPLRLAPVLTLGALVPIVAEWRAARSVGTN